MAMDNATDTQRFLEFMLGEESYAVELLHVREVIPLPELTPIPKSPPYVLGLMNLRGLVLTVVDLRKKLGIQPNKEQTQSSVIIFDLGDRLVGGQVDSILRVVNIKEETIKPVPEADAHTVTQNLKGIIQTPQKLILWMDIRKLLVSTPQSSKAA